MWVPDERAIFQMRFGQQAQVFVTLNLLKLVVVEVHGYRQFPFRFRETNMHLHLKKLKVIKLTAVQP